MRGPGATLKQRREVPLPMLAVCRLLLPLLLMVPAAAAVGTEPVHHDIDVRLDPDGRRLAVEDRITLPDGVPRTLTFGLHAGLGPRVVGGGAELAPAGRGRDGAVPVETWRLELEPGVRQVTLAYSGEIHHPVAELGEEYARSFSVSPGLIGPDGVFLGGSSHWLPAFADRPYLTFEMTVSLPGDWRSVSQGRRTARDVGEGPVREIWVEGHPQEEVYLIAGRFNEYRRPGAAADAVVFLREPDQALAGRYLDLTGRYLAMYQGLIGDYPYAKFALVENFWETGYGMPSFTLLGPRVIRLPFIPYTSYPHEILHNWWGNGVYVDFASGNWSEGLTSYLADHLLKEQRGLGADYRREALQKYGDYVGGHGDFPLTEFRGRHDSVTEAVGYGKTLMVFHMLRRQLGDEAFIAGLRRLYAGHRFQVAAWSDVAAAFDAAAGAPLDAFFAEWIERPGAPELRLRDVAVDRAADGYRLRGVVEQTQDGPAYDLQVPLAVMLDDRDQALVQTIAMDGREQGFELDLPARPLRLAVDPDFDLFRRLYREEVPPAISQALGAERVLIVLPAAAPGPLRDTYRRLAEAWQRGRPAQMEVLRDDELKRMPDDRAVWLLGWENRFRPVLDEALSGYDIAAVPDGVRVAGKTLTRADNSVVVLARHPGNPDQALGWLATDDVAAMPGLARKLPHYGKYSYLGFAGDGPDNVLKGQWPAQQSPLSVALAGETSPPMVLPARQPLAELPPAFSADRMMDDVRQLADPALKGRGLGSAGLDAAGSYIAAQFEAAGLSPAGDGEGGWYQSWRVRSGSPERDVRLRNVVGLLPGRDPALADRPLVIGAHYDHLGLGWPDVREGNAGKVHPGADDNGSGVAVLLELARTLSAGAPPERPILFVAFTGEEAGRLGSRHFVEQASAAGTRIFGMLNLDTVGRLGDGPLYALGAGSAGQWVHILRGAGYVTGVGVEVVDEPLDSSDQTSFIAAGIPAVQLFSGAHADYHRPTDTLDKVDADGLVRVASVAGEAIDYLAGRDARLTPAAGGAAAESAAESGTRASSPRRAALGTVPDFAFDGEGVRLSGVMPESPAAGAGLREGDVVLAVNGRSVAGLRAYAEALRALAPGDRVEIQYLRDGETRRVETQAVER